MEKLLPKYTVRRIVGSLLLTLATNPFRLHHRLNVENVLLFKAFRRVRAHCCICGGMSRLFFGIPDRKLRRDHEIGLLRETLLCEVCGSTNRQRTLAYALKMSLDSRAGVSTTTVSEAVGNLPPIKIWDTDAFSPLKSQMLTTGRIIYSKFLPQHNFGIELEDRTYNIDLQKINFESNRFDFILSSDIMEHVRRDDLAHAEIFRCLKPGGQYVFTVPYNENREDNLRLVDTSSPTDIILQKPHYHGDPLTGGILAYRIYGRKLIRDLQQEGFAVEFKRLNIAAEGIFDGDCFIATKPDR